MADKKKQALAPLMILAVCVAAALGAAFYMSSEEAAPPAAPPDPEAFVDLAGGGQMRGAENPALVLVEFGDYGCPHCAAYHTVVMELLRRMPDELALEFHHWPIPVSRNSPMASQAAEAAGEQGMYWEMHDAVFERLNEWSGLADGATYFTNLAGELGLDTNRFRQDMMSEAVMNRVIADMSRGRALGVDSTPTFFLDGQFVDLPADPAQAEALLRAMGGL